MRILLLALVLLACSSKDADPAPSDLSGTWSFTIDSLNSGSFKIEKNSNSGEFYLYGQSIKINGTSSVSTTAINIGDGKSMPSSISLIDANINSIILNSVTGTTTVTAKSYEVNGPSYTKSGTESILITRH